MAWLAVLVIGLSGVASLDTVAVFIDEATTGALAVLGPQGQLASAAFEVRVPTSGELLPQPTGDTPYSNGPSLQQLVRILGQTPQAAAEALGILEQDGPSALALASRHFASPLQLVDAQQARKAMISSAKAVDPGQDPSARGHGSSFTDSMTRLSKAAGSFGPAQAVDEAFDSFWKTCIDKQLPAWAESAAARPSVTGRSDPPKEARTIFPALARLKDAAAAVSAKDLDDVTSCVESCSGLHSALKTAADKCLRELIKPPIFGAEGTTTRMDKIVSCIKCSTHWAGQQQSMAEVAIRPTSTISGERIPAEWATAVAGMAIAQGLEKASTAFGATTAAKHVLLVAPGRLHASSSRSLVVAAAIAGADASVISIAPAAATAALLRRTESAQQQCLGAHGELCDIGVGTGAGFVFVESTPVGLVLTIVTSSDGVVDAGDAVCRKPKASTLGRWLGGQGGLEDELATCLSKAKRVIDLEASLSLTVVGRRVEGDPDAWAAAPAEAMDVTPSEFSRALRTAASGGSRQAELVTVSNEQILEAAGSLTSSRGTLTLRQRVALPLGISSVSKQKFQAVQAFCKLESHPGRGLDDALLMLRVLGVDVELLRQQGKVTCSEVDKASSYMDVNFMSTVLGAGAVLPALKTGTFHATTDGQTIVALRVTEGHCILASLCQELASASVSLPVGATPEWPDLVVKFVLGLGHELGVAAEVQEARPSPGSPSTASPSGKQTAMNVSVTSTAMSAAEVEAIRRRALGQDYGLVTSVWAAVTGALSGLVSLLWE